MMRDVVVEENDELNVSSEGHDAEFCWKNSLIFVQEVFFAVSTGTSLEFSSSTIRNNEFPGGFNFVNGAQGAVVTVQDSLFENNAGIRVGHQCFFVTKFSKQCDLNSCTFPVGHSYTGR